jgi:hypothetical protein
MKKIKPSNENEMVCEFLKMELNSARYSKPITALLEEMGVTDDIIINGDIISERENALRADILRRFRGWRDLELFKNFPTKIDWHWSVFDNEDIYKIVYIEYSYWNELSHYTGSPLVAAKTILSGQTIYDVPNDWFLKGVQQLKEGCKFPPMIFLTDAIESRYIILEGHGRMTAYGLVPELFQDVSVLLGYCEHEELNAWYGKMPICAEKRT